MNFSDSNSITEDMPILCVRK